MYIDRHDDIISFYIYNEIVMYYNTQRHVVVLLAVKLPYNEQHLNINNYYLFYDFRNNTNPKEKALMPYEQMIANVMYIFDSHNISVSKHVRYCTT